MAKAENKVLTFQDILNQAQIVQCPNCIGYGCADCNLKGRIQAVSVDVLKQWQQDFLQFIDQHSIRKDTYGVYDPMELARPTISILVIKLKELLDVEK